MTKYYLDGQLIRTSKNNNYEFALVTETSGGIKKVRTCSSTIQGASKLYNYYTQKGFHTYIATLDKVEC